MPFPFSPLRINNETFEPFESEQINLRLNPLGYVYSGGIGIFHKPYFFLAKLEQTRIHDGITLLLSSEEYARELVAPPAMLQGNTVYIRKPCLRRVIWERIEEWLLKKPPNSPMARMLACYLPHLTNSENNSTATHNRQIESILGQITDTEMHSVLLHETGEAQAGQLLGPNWESLLNQLPRGKAEFIMRAVRDHMADSLTTLPALLKTENAASLHFYFANFTGMRHELFPEALLAYQSWVESGNLTALKNIIHHGKQHWQTLAEQILALHDTHTDMLIGNIEALPAIHTSKFDNLS